MDKQSEEICNELISTAKRYSSDIKKGTILYRCQKGCVFIKKRLGVIGHPKPDDKYYWEPHPFDKERMTPQSDRAKEGRINPKGLPCLYLAENEITAIQEMHPLPNQLLTIAKFRASKNIRISNVFADIKENSDHEEWFWSALGRAFSLPILNTDDQADYSPTQYLAARLSQVGFEGISYRSCFNQQRNYAIFNSDDFEFMSSDVKHLARFRLLEEEDITSPESIVPEVVAGDNAFPLSSHSFLLSGCDFKESEN